MCSKVLNGHIILTDTSITTILAPEMTYTPSFFGIRTSIQLKSVQPAPVGCINFNKVSVGALVLLFRSIPILTTSPTLYLYYMDG